MLALRDVVDAEAERPIRDRGDRLSVERAAGFDDAVDALAARYFALAREDRVGAGAVVVAHLDQHPVRRGVGERALVEARRPVDHADGLRRERRRDRPVRPPLALNVVEAVDPELLAERRGEASRRVPYELIVKRLIRSIFDPEKPLL